MNAFERMVQTLAEPPKAAPPGRKRPPVSREQRRRSAIKSAIQLLRRHGYTVEPPPRAQ